MTPHRTGPNPPLPRRGALPALVAALAAALAFGAPAHAQQKIKRSG